MGLAGQQMRSSFVDGLSAKINPDLWLTDRAQCVITTTRLHPAGTPCPRWIETLVWDMENGRITSTIIDRQTGKVGVGEDPSYQSFATSMAKKAVGMP
jgi:hypothetical protein